jgi:hypothetical protein
VQPGGCRRHGLEQAVHEADAFIAVGTPTSGDGYVYAERSEIAGRSGLHRGRHWSTVPVGTGREHITARRGRHRVRRGVNPGPA